MRNSILPLGFDIKMKAGPPNDPPRDARLDENDPVWRLLACAPRPEPDAWFAVRTLARCRYEGMDAEAGGISPARLGRMWRWALGGGLAFSMALAFVVTQSYSERERADKQKNVQEAFEIMASIDTDSDSSSSSSSWQDSSF
jgi:hypothetical protein